MRRREREHRADALEAVPARVFVERAGRIDIEVHAEQIVNRVAVFLAAEAVVRHGTAIGHARRLAFFDARGNPVGDFPQFGGLGLRFLFWRHLAGVDAKQNFGPALGVRQVIEIGGQRVHAEVALLLLLAVAAEAVLGEERLGRSIGGGRIAPYEVCDQTSNQRQRAADTAVSTLHAVTSETPPRLSANFSVFTSIFCAMVSSRLLRRAFSFTGLKWMPACLS